MKKAVIIEDEKAVCNALITALKEAEPDVQIEATLSSVKESIDYFMQQPDTDIILSDVQLTDGLSFSIFKELDINAPIIFITGYDRFIMNAFEHNSIDYLLKPICKEDLVKALNKYKRLEQHFTHNNFFKTLFKHLPERKRTRLIVKKGLEHVTLLLNDVVVFFTENKVSYAVDKCGKRYLIDRNLTDLEQELDQKSFFRVNRQYIVNIDYIRSFKAYERVKLQVELTLPDLHHFIIVSQETAPLFKKWISEG